MRDYCDLDCGACRVRRVFGQCPRDVVDDRVIEYVQNAWQIGYEEGLRIAEQAVEYALEGGSPSVRTSAAFCRRN